VCVYIYIYIYIPLLQRNITQCCAGHLFSATTFRAYLSNIWYHIRFQENKRRYFHLRSSQERHFFIVDSTEVVNDPRRPALPNEFESFVKEKSPVSGVVTRDTHQLISDHKNASSKDSYCVVSSGLLQVHNPVFCIKLITRSNKSGQCAN